MNFNESVIYKKSLPDEIIEGDMVMKPYVIPSLPEDINNYFDAWREFIMSDASAKNYCSNGIYTVEYICFKGDINRLYRKIVPL